MATRSRFLCLLFVSTVLCMLFLYTSNNTGYEISRYLKAIFRRDVSSCNALMTAGLREDYREPRFSPIPIEACPSDDICDDIDFLVAVFTRPNPEGRERFRTTYGRPELMRKFRYKLLFPLGHGSNTNITEDIRKEAEEYGDIIQGRFQEAYTNLTYKTLLYLRYVANHCSNVKAIVKVDDDVTFNIGMLADYVANNVTADQFYCMLWKNYGAFPTFCSGTDPIFTPRVAQKLVDVVKNATYCEPEDVLSSGVLAKIANISHTELPFVCSFCKYEKAVAKKNGKIPYMFSWMNVENHTKLFFEYNKEYLSALDDKNIH